jgi:glycosyltransferase involved in cell wall biosynthesis
VLVGPNPQALAVTELGDAALRDRLCYLGHVSDGDLSALYRQAALFAYLSEDEGFGLPLIEAMRSGVPVLTLDRPVSREVVGAAAHLIPDARPESVASALATLLSDHSYRASLAVAGANRAAEFDWSVTARRTLDVLTSVVRH